MPHSKWLAQFPFLAAAHTCQYMILPAIALLSGILSIICPLKVGLLDLRAVGHLYLLIVSHSSDLPVANIFFWYATYFLHGIIICCWGIFNWVPMTANAMGGLTPPFLNSLHIWLLYLLVYKPSGNSFYRTILSQRDPSHLEITRSQPWSLLEWLGNMRVYKACPRSPHRTMLKFPLCPRGWIAGDAIPLFNFQFCLLPALHPFRCVWQTPT